MFQHYAFLALDLARERAAEAARERFAAQVQPTEVRVNRVRRAIARLAVEVARAADARTAEARIGEGHLTTS